MTVEKLSEHLSELDSNAEVCFKLLKEDHNRSVLRIEVEYYLDSEDALVADLVRFVLSAV